MDVGASCQRSEGGWKHQAAHFRAARELILPSITAQRQTTFRSPVKYQDLNPES